MSLLFCSVVSIGEVLEPTDVVSLLLPGVLLGLCVVGCFGCSVQRVRRRRRARQGAGGESEEAAKEEAAVQIIPSAMEVQERRDVIKPYNLIKLYNLSNIIKIRKEKMLIDVDRC